MDLVEQLVRRAMAEESIGRKPATAAQLARLVLPRHRDGSGDAPPPKSLLALLAIDRGWTCWGKPIVPPPPSRGPWRLPSVTIDATIRDVMRVPFATLPKKVKVWRDDPDQPALVPLPSGGDQRSFLYVTTLDEDGEYPVVTFDDEPAVWVTRASLAEYVAGELAHRLREKVDAATPFRAALARAKKRHARAIAKERWSDDPVFVHFLQTGELPAPKKASKPAKRGSVAAILSLREQEETWAKPYKDAVRALVTVAASFDDDTLLAILRDEPWPSGNAAAQVLVANAAGKPTATVARTILEIDRRRANDIGPNHEGGWGQNGFAHELSRPLVAIFVESPGSLEQVRAATIAAGLVPAYETFLAPMVKKAARTAKRRVRTGD